MPTVPNKWIEKRTEPRQDVGNEIVQLESKLGAPLTDCLLFDLSEHGARLLIPQEIELARVVHVVVGNIRKPAWVAWRKDAQIGIEFLDAAPLWQQFRDPAL